MAKHAIAANVPIDAMHIKHCLLAIEIRNSRKVNDRKGQEKPLVLLFD